jgi:TPR repeat protein
MKIFLASLLLAVLSNLSYAVDFAETLKLAEQGDARAQYNMGWMYDNGTGVPENDKTAVMWYTKAAKQGVAWAQSNLGWMYYKGKGVPENDKTAVMWYTKAAEQGIARAQANLASMYANGKGVPENDKTAVMWYAKAAKQGHAAAQHNLGVMYANGEGVPENDVKAYVWWSMAKANGDDHAKGNLETLKKTMTREQIAKAQELAAKCYESDYKDCRQGIGYNSKNKDLKKTEEWYLKAANTGDDEGIYDLVLFYKYTLENIEKAKYWIEKYPKNKNSQTMYRYGTFEDRPGYSLENEHEWLLKSAKLGYFHSCRELGWNYTEGTEFLSRDLDQAFYWFKKIAENDKDSFDNNAGWYGMGNIYEIPEYRNYNLSKALEYYNLILKNSKSDNQWTMSARSRKAKLEARGVK